MKKSWGMSVGNCSPIAPRPRKSHAVTVHVGTRSNLSGYPTYQDVMQCAPFVGGVTSSALPAN